jgi:hypothetical protein
VSVAAFKVVLLHMSLWRFFVSCTISEFPFFSPTDDVDERHVEDAGSTTATPEPMEEEAELLASMSTLDMGQPMEDGPLPTNTLGLATNPPRLPSLPSLNAAQRGDVQDNEGDGDEGIGTNPVASCLQLLVGRLSCAPFYLRCFCHCT